jgi:hypothetical protein
MDGGVKNVDAGPPPMDGSPAMRYDAGEKEHRMKKLPIVLVVVALALSGCASGRFLGFLATNDYVDQKNKELADKQALEISQLKAQVAEDKALLEQAKTAVDQVKDLQALAKRVESKLTSVPKDVIKQIIEALQSSLDQ